MATPETVVKKLGPLNGRRAFNVSKPDEAPARPAPAGKLAKREAAAVDEALTFAGLANKIQVHDEAGLTVAKDYLQDLRTMAGKVEATFDPQITRAHELHKSLLAEKKKFYEPLMAAERIVKRAVGNFYEEQDRRRIEAEKERQRIEKEALDKAQELEAEAANAKTQDDRDAAIDKAVAVLQTADEKAQQATAGAATVKIAGISVSDTWHFEIVDAGLVPAEYWTLDLVRIGKVVRALKGDTKIPGVRTYSEKAVANRAL